MSTKRPVMRYHGGKFRLAPWLIGFFPAHMTYVEPFGGAAGVLMQKPPSPLEIYNDLDSEIYNVFKVLQCPFKSEVLKQACMITPYSREEFELAFQEVTEPTERARRTIVRASMGFGSAGATKNTTGFRIDAARRSGGSSDLWDQYPELIASFCRRLKRVVLENKPALEVIDNHDGDDTLFFVDPPYEITSRRPGGMTYRHEMSEQDHIDLLDKLKSVSGAVVITSYESELYSEHLSGWTRHSTATRASAGKGGSTERIESAWLNPKCMESSSSRGLFDEINTTENSNV